MEKERGRERNYSHVSLERINERKMEILFYQTHRTKFFDNWTIKIIPIEMKDSIFACNLVFHKKSKFN